jgi:hypothetical protein
MALYNLPPRTSSYGSAPFSIENIIYLFTKQATLARLGLNKGSIKLKLPMIINLGGVLYWLRHAVFLTLSLVVNAPLF